MNMLGNPKVKDERTVTPVVMVGMKRVKRGFDVLGVSTNYAKTLLVTMNYNKHKWRWAAWLIVQQQYID